MSPPRTSLVMAAARYVCKSRVCSSGRALSGCGGSPDRLEVGGEAGKEPTRPQSTEVEQRGFRTMQAVEVGCDTHLLVEAEDRIVERGRVVADLDARVVPEVLQVTQCRE